MENNNKKLLATGLTGLIGKELVEPLKALGFDIYCITIDESNPDNGVHWIKGSLFDSQFIKSTMEEVKPDYLLNMAWATTGDYLSSNINYDFLNAGITLIKSFCENGGKRAVFAGTCFEYKFKDEPLKECDELESERTAYTFCKNKLREISQFVCQKYGVNFGYGRIFYVYGKGEHHKRLTGCIIDRFSRDEEVLITSGPLVKDYMYSKDIAGAFAKFLDSDVNGIVNICTGKGVSIRDYSMQLAEKLGKVGLLKFEDNCAKDPKFIIGDNSRLINEVGYEIKYDLATAFDEIV